MAEQIQTPGPSGQLTERLGIKGGLRLLLDAVISPIIIIKDPERRYAACAFSIPAVAGEVSEFAIVNPLLEGLGDQELWVHEVVIVSSISTLTFQLVNGTGGISGFNTITDKSFFKFRNGIVPRAFVGFDTPAAPTTGPEFMRTRVLANTPAVFSMWKNPIKLGNAPTPSAVEAATLVARSGTVNVTVHGTCVWSEPANPI